MHAMVKYILFMVLVILSLFQLFPSPIMVNARKWTTKNGIFSVDLIRRNSSKITLHGSGQGRLSLGSISHHHQITLSSKFYDLKTILNNNPRDGGVYDKTTVQSVIIPDGGEFDMKISIGTPPVEFTAIADTGSDLIWVECSPCQRCIGKKSPLFDPTQSSSDNIIPCTSPFCHANQLGFLKAGCSQNNDNSCMYTYRYGDGSQTTGVLSTDTVTFPSSSTPDVIFGCGYDQEGSLDSLGDGMVGLGGGPLSLVSQLGSTINYKFSYCLTPIFSGVNSKLNFGLDVTDPGVISTPFAQQDTPPTTYYVALDTICIGGTSVPVNKNIIIDSGTTLTYLPSDIYDGIKTAVEASIGLTPINNNQNQMYDPCYETDSLDGLNFPGMVFHFSGGEVVLNAENSFFTEDGLVCFAMVATDSPIFIFGNIAQTNFHIGYDLQAKQVSFAPADCTQF